MTSQPTDAPARIFLTGMMGAGKSSVGAPLARLLGVPFIDLDDEIGRREGSTAGEVIRIRGEAYFRGAESQALRLLGRREGFVMATGGGVVESRDNRDYMRGRGMVVYLRVPPTVLVGRLSLDPEDRPLLDGDRAGRIGEILVRREPLYAEAAMVVDAAGGDPAAVAARIAGLLGVRR